MTITRSAPGITPDYVFCAFYGNSLVYGGAALWKNLVPQGAYPFDANYNYSKYPWPQISVPVSVPDSVPPSQHNTTALTTKDVQTQWQTETAGGQWQTDVTYNEWPGVTDGVWRTTDTYGGPAQTLVGVLQNTTATTTAMRDTQRYNTWPEGITTVIWQTAVSTNTTVGTVVDGPAPTQTSIQRLTTFPGGLVNTNATTTVERQTTWPTNAV
jgi:hypothetical protein